MVFFYLFSGHVTRIIDMPYLAAQTNLVKRNFGGTSHVCIPIPHAADLVRTEQKCCIIII